jgi:D-sedoheptulose 7-phosphate isomerase
MHSFIRQELSKLTELLTLIHQDDSLLANITSISHRCAHSLLSGNKLLFAGNGGSAADAQHLAAELMGRLRYNRPGIPAISLTTDTSVLTALSNDFGFEHIFSHQIDALGQENDVFIAISTSGQSPNIIKAIEVARQKKLIVILLTGSNTPEIAEHCDYIIQIPSLDTQKIQECHIVIGHILCALIEDLVTNSIKQKKNLMAEA